MSAQISIRDMFFEESEELLEALAEGLALMSSGSHNDETVNAVFRAVHSIKGGAGAFKLAALVGFAHRFETVLDELRSHRLDLEPEVMHTLQRSADHLTDLVEDARNGDDTDTGQTAEFLAALDACLGSPPSAEAADDDAGFAFAAISMDLLDLDGPTDSDVGAPEQNFTILFRPHSALFTNGHDPALLIAALADLGTVTTELDLSRLRDVSSFDPTEPKLGWMIRLSTLAERAAIDEVFEFVEGLCDLHIAVSNSVEEPSLQPEISIDPELEIRPVTVFAESGTEGIALEKTEIRSNVRQQIAAREDGPGESGNTEARGPKPTLRVDLDRVDRLINAVGELIINQSMIAQRVQELRLATDADVVTHVEDYRLLARDIQEAVMAIRAQPVKPLFQRMSRIVREAADSTGKNARLVTHGEGAEVDKTVVERLADPLTHMIRNAVDHGLESIEARIAAGKDPCGTIHLSAAHRSGAVIITIRDDGAGLNRRKILEIARNKNLISPEAEPSDSEIDALLFLPGFSTASTVSNLSGRGVGLDVVRNAVTTLGGRVTIASTPGHGTEFTISLPLTLAVLDGMVVSVAGQIMVIPITSILETIRPGDGDLHIIGTSDRLLLIRGKFIPVVDVAQGLGFVRPPLLPAPDTLLLVETENQGQCALMVDRVFDQRQVVIKALDTNYGAVPGVSAATVLGDGQIALILDPEAIANNRVQQTAEHWSSAKLNEGKSLAVA
ncbi:chemotaxis protein CheA [Rhodobacter ferrooxidans]|uniref:Chemotaxis protein CheA n=1 Tax=Rhodobacter ferrooxidans TaxID=371731 RepID=C8S4D1_9RHOB|nr:chemotaxis protein CheA [Rhodobacter sp. SW2]EEW24190.1 CheA signal transduction histidine kinase [Rhodobacter sp. SW2]